MTPTPADDVVAALAEAHIGAFKTTDPLRIEQAENGGWVVYSCPHELGFKANLIGAYSNAWDMIRALGEALCPAEFAALRDAREGR